MYKLIALASGSRWNYVANIFHCAYRSWIEPAARYGYFGFRIATRHTRNPYRLHVVRSGSWDFYIAGDFRCADRYGNVPAYRDEVNGFRIERREKCIS